MSASAWRTGAGGLELFLRVTPKSAADRIGPVVPDADDRQRLNIHVRAAPDKGRANAAVLALLAKAGGWRKSDLCLVAGEKSRLKTVLISGSPAAIAARLQLILANTAP